MSDISPRSRKVRRILSTLLPVPVLGLLLLLSVAPGCCRRTLQTGGNGAPADTANGTVGGGVTVTKEVPHSKETIPEIMDRERRNPLPPRGDRAIHPHGIPRTGSDNGACIPPVDDRTVK